MKKLIILLLLLIPNLQSCKKGEEVTVNLLKCNYPAADEWFVESDVKNVTATIKRSQFSDSMNQFVIVLDDKDYTVVPCNLPTDFETMNARVVLSGKIYNHPRIDFAYPPIELSLIKHANK